MSPELMYKIEEKLGGAIDLMTFDNAQQIVDYLSRYIQLSNLIPTLIAGVICIICIIVVLILYKNKEDNIEMIVVSAIIGIVSFGLFIAFLYDTIMAYNFPIAAIVEWLK